MVVLFGIFCGGNALSRTSRFFVTLAVLAFLLNMTSSEALAQNAAGRIIGNVTDPSGASVSGAMVTVTNVATQVSQKVVTDKDGYFQVLAVPIGKYSVAFEKDGFQRQVFENQVLQINQSLRVDAKLEIGAKNEVIEVKDQVEVVETVNPTIGASVTGRTLTDMPLNGRNALNLALLQPGVTPTNDLDAGSGQAYNIAGGRSDSVTFLLDGGLNNENLGNGVVFNPNPDTISEFRILENNYTAEYGRNGGGVITEVVKSGTNEWHGSAFDFIRNGAFNANSFFNKNDPKNLLPRDTLRRNQYGGTFGGPITIPKVVHGKDRFFFFVGYQGQRQSESQSSPGNLVLTTAQLKGDFSNGGTPGNCPNADAGVAAFLVANPFFQGNNAAAKCGIIDPAKINGVSQKYIGAGLIPSSATGTLNVQAPATNNDNQLTMKFDFNITPKDRLSVTLGGDRNPTLLPFAGSGLLGYADTTTTNNYFSNFAYTRTFSANILNEFRVTVQRQNTLQDKPASSIPTHAAVGEVGITPDLESGAAKLRFFDEGTLLGFSIQGPSTLINNTFAYSDVFSWSRGRHNLKFGGSFSAYQFNTAFDFFGSGEFVFVGQGGIGSGNDFADFLFGIPAFFQQGPNAPTNARSKYYSGFAQDEWRVNKKLVLTLGVRYEYGSPKLDTHGFTFNVIPGQHSKVFPNAPSGLVFPGDANAPRGVNFPDRKDWAPRFGFAWDPKGDSKTSIRGGFGMFYDVLKAEDNFQDNGQPPFFAAGFSNFSPLAANPTADVPYMAQPYASTGAVNPFPSKPPDHNVNFLNAGLTPFGSTSIFLDDPHLKTPYVYQYNLSIQRQIARATSLEVGYVGSSSHGLTSLVDINPFIPGTKQRILNLLPGNSTCPEANGNLSFQCSFSNLPEFKNVANASYNGLTASLTRQVSDSPVVGRAYFVLGYTYAHSIDDASGFRNNNFAVPTFNPKLFRGSSDFDVRNRITFSGGWDLPFDNLWKSGPKRLTQGWSLYPIFSWRQGFPLTISGAVDTSGGFTNPGVTGAGDLVTVHANLTGQPVTTFNPRNVQTLTGDASGTNTGNFFFNPAAFTTQQVGSSSDPCVAPSPTCFPSTAQVIANPSLLTYGTAARDLLRGPGRVNLDMSLAKTTAITERLKLEIRVDTFNLFNHAEFADPITSIASPQFGQIVATGSNVTGAPNLARVLQLAVRSTF
jgi:Carboxypeptidase regulatory-like domain/TonB-dependent Receptor Plug Domain